MLARSSRNSFFLTGVPVKKMLKVKWYFSFDEHDEGEERLMWRRRWVEMCLKHANYFSRSLALPEQNFVSCSYLLSCAICPTWKEKLNDTWSEKNCSLKPYTLKQMIRRFIRGCISLQEFSKSWIFSIQGLRQVIFMCLWHLWHSVLFTTFFATFAYISLHNAYGVEFLIGINTNCIRNVIQ